MNYTRKKPTQWLHAPIVRLKGLATIYNFFLLYARSNIQISCTFWFNKAMSNEALELRREFEFLKAVHEYQIYLAGTSV